MLGGWCRWFGWIRFEKVEDTAQFSLMLKGILSWSAKFSYIKEFILPSSETYFILSKSKFTSINQAKTENLCTSGALKSGYMEEYSALKNG